MVCKHSSAPSASACHLDEIPSGFWNPSEVDPPLSAHPATVIFKDAGDTVSNDVKDDVQDTLLFTKCRRPPVRGPLQRWMPSPASSHLSQQSGVDTLENAVEGEEGGEYRLGTGGLNKSKYRGVSYDKKKRKWRVQIKVASLGKSGVSVGYYDTEHAAALAYDRAAIGLLGHDNANIVTNFPLADYDNEEVPDLTGKSREQVKAALKTERAKLQTPRRRFSNKHRTSIYMGVGATQRKGQWQARILVNGKVTHLGYYESEEAAARAYDRVNLTLHGEHAQTNFGIDCYKDEDLSEYKGLGREELQRVLGVHPLDTMKATSQSSLKWVATLEPKCDLDEKSVDEAVVRHDGAGFIPKLEEPDDDNGHGCAKGCTSDASGCSQPCNESSPYTSAHNVGSRGFKRTASVASLPDREDCWCPVWLPRPRLPHLHPPQVPSAERKNAYPEIKLAEGFTFGAPPLDALTGLDCHPFQQLKEWVPLHLEGLGGLAPATMGAWRSTDGSTRQYGAFQMQMQSPGGGGCGSESLLSCRPRPQRDFDSPGPAHSMSQESSYIRGSSRACWQDAFADPLGVHPGGESEWGHSGAPEAGAMPVDVPAPGNNSGGWWSQQLWSDMLLEAPCRLGLTSEDDQVLDDFLSWNGASGQMPPLPEVV